MPRCLAVGRIGRRGPRGLRGRRACLRRAGSPRPGHRGPFRAAWSGGHPGGHAVQGRRRAGRLRGGLHGCSATCSRSGRGHSCSPRRTRRRWRRLPGGAGRHARGGGLFARLWANTRRFKAELARLGFDTGASETPITPIMVGESEAAIRFSDRLFEAGIFATSVVYPTVPLDGARLRTIVTAAHTTSAWIVPSRRWPAWDGNWVSSPAEGHPSRGDADDPRLSRDARHALRPGAGSRLWITSPGPSGQKSARQSFSADDGLRP